ncbi:hypothetical protein ON010_g13445 [Phytophthora cinnamomi]|nr:hypothetical protein ON010_g13445 [Phytophthora cinnamomi]
MKITIMLLCAAFGAAAAAPCNTTALSQLLVTGNVRTCRAESGYNPMSMTAPTNAQVSALCNSDACMKAIGEVKQVAPNECTIGPACLYANVIDPLMQRCGKKSGSVGAATGSVSASGSGAGPSVGDASGSGYGSAPLAGDGGSGSASSRSTYSGSATKSPGTSKLRTNSPARPRTGSSTASGNGGPEAPTLSTCAAVVVLAVMVAALL